MAYFSYFPKVEYDVRGDGSTTVMTNLTRRTRFRDYFKRNAVNYDYYDVKAGETPEYIANEFYGDPELHWVVLLVNDITDRYHQWPMNYSQFNQYINDKYVNADGTSNVDGVHHYEIAQSSGNTDTKIEVYNNSALFTGDTDFYASATTVTNREYEENLQNERRSIRLLDPQYIEQFVQEFEELMAESII